MTLPHKVSRAPASDRTGPSLTSSDALICPDHEIFDSAEVNAQLSNAFKDSKDNSQMRAATVRILRVAQCCFIFHLQKQLK